MWINTSGSKINTRFANKLYVNKQQRNGLNINDLLRLPVNIFWKNKHGFYLGCNDITANAIGFRSRVDIIGANLYDFAEQTSADRLNKIDCRVINKQLTHYCIETAKVKKLNNYLTNPLFSTYVSIKRPMYNSDGIIIGMFGFSINFMALNYVNLDLFADCLSQDKLNTINQLIGNYLLSCKLGGDELTNREKECLFYLSRGRTAKEIGLILGISPKTVESYWDAAKLKLNCINRSSLIDKYLEYRLLEN